MEKKTYKSSSNLTLKGNSWPKENCIGHIIIMEGMTETTSRYNNFANYLNSLGFSVDAIDFFGQGENVFEDLSNIGVLPFKAYDLYLSFVDRLVSELKADNKPVYIFAHSMGSFLAQVYIQKYPLHVKKVVLCGSGCKNPAVPLAVLLAKLTTRKSSRNKQAKFLSKLMFGNFNKAIKNPKTEYDWLSYDEDNVSSYLANPLCGFPVNKGFCYEFIHFMNTLWKKKELKKIDLSQEIFLISGIEDPVTNYSKGTDVLEKMYKDLGIKNVSKKIYKTARHEILNEVSNGVSSIVYKDVGDFFLKL